MEQNIASDIERALSKLEVVSNNARQEMESRRERYKKRQQYHTVSHQSVYSDNASAIQSQLVSAPQNSDISESESEDNKQNDPISTCHVSSMKGQLQGVLQEIMTLRRHRESLEKRIVV